MNIYNSRFDCKINNEELIEKAKNGHEDSKRKLFLNNIPLIRKRVRRLKTMGISIDEQELFSEGLVALQKAYTSYDQNSGCRFVTLLRKCVDNELNNYIRVANRIKFTLYSKISLDEKFDNEEDKETTYHDRVSIQDKSLEHCINILTVEKLFSKFKKIATEKELFVINKVYYGNMQMSELAKEMGYTRQRIHQIHASGMQKLRRYI